jgi:hypothetical protein
MAKTKTLSPLPSPKRKRLGSRDGTVITSLALPRPLHREAMVAAVRLNWTFAEVMRAALDEWLARHHLRLTGKEGGSR